MSCSGVEVYQNVSDKVLEEETSEASVWIPQKEKEVEADLLEIQIVNLPLAFTRLSNSLPGKLHLTHNQVG